MGRCDGECGVSPIGSTTAETANGFPPMNGKFKEAPENFAMSKISDNSLKTHTIIIDGDLISLQSPKHNSIGYSLRSTESLSNNHHQKTTISTQTPPSSHQT